MIPNLGYLGHSGQSVPRVGGGDPVNSGTATVKP